MDSERFNPLKVIRWTDDITAILAGENRGPIRANIDLTNLCNHKCAWCEPLAFREQTIADKKHTLASDVALTLLKDLAEMGCQAVYFSGGGEPTLHPDFGSILWEAHNLGMRTFIITNGSRIKKYGPHFLTYADNIRVSLDASSEAEHMAIHGSKSGDFGEICGSLKFTLDLRNTGWTTARPEVGISYTVESRNNSLESLVRAMALAESIGVDYIQFRPVSEGAFSGNGAMDRIPVLAADFPKLKVLAMNWRNSDVLTQREFGSCYSALTVAVIGATGDVHACCDNRAVVFGNVYEKPFKDIWLSAEHREKAAGITPKLCPRCLQCGFNRAVEKYVVHNEAIAEFV